MSKHKPSAGTNISRRQRFLILIVIVVALLGGGAVLAAHTLSTPASKLSTSPACLYSRHTLCTGVALASLGKGELADFTKQTGVFPTVVEYYQAFGKPFSTKNAELVGLVHARPFIQINPHGVAMSDVAAGKYDPYLKAYAVQVRDFRLPVMLSFGHEMNGSWSSWSLPWTKPADFVAGYRHIHDIFRAEHVRNVIWTWDFSSGFVGKGAKARNPAPWWPGTHYVDWIGIDGYLLPGTSFAGRFTASLQLAHKLASAKPVFIAETAVAPGTGQVHGIQQLFTEAKQHRLKALVWFDVNRRAKWRLERSTAAATAFRAAVQAAR